MKVILAVMIAMMVVRGEVAERCLRPKHTNDQNVLIVFVGRPYAPPS